MSELSLDALLTPGPNVAFRDLGGESVLLDLTSGTYFGLNEVGTRTWALIAGGGSLRAVHERLLDEFDVSSETLEQDLISLVSTLCDKGLLTRSG